MIDENISLTPNGCDRSVRVSLLEETMRLVALVGLTFAALLLFGCANGDFIITSGQQQNFGLGGVAQSNAFVDWSKPASAQTGTDHPQYEGIGAP